MQTQTRLNKFFSYYKPYLGLLTLDMICAVIVAVILLTLPLGAREITNALQTLDAQDATQRISQVGLFMLGLMLCHCICLYFVDYKGHMMGAYMERDMRSELFSHLQTLSFSFYDEHKVGQLMTRISSDTNNLAELYHHGPEDILITIIKFFGTFVILVNINAPLTLLIFAFIPPMLVYAFYFSKKMYVALRAGRDRMGDINARIEDALGGIRVITSFTNESYEQSRFDQENHRFLLARDAGYKSEAKLSVGMITFTQMFTLVVIVMGGQYILDGSFEIVDLITFLLYVALLVDPIRTALNFTRLYQSGITGFDRFMEVLEMKPEIVDSPQSKHLIDCRGKIEFDNVSFSYQNNKIKVLSDFSLTIREGEFLALVGSSGVGKTTLCSLIPRFYESSMGQIRIDGQDIKQIQLDSLRGNIAVVQQDVHLFDGTVMENIRYGNLNAGDEEIVDSAIQAEAHDFILRLPEGYQTQIGQRGVKLSGGQKQRLSIARAFLKDPAILIFDEATSALDNVSERAIKSSFEKLRRNRTTIVIAHRLSTVQNAERIVVLSETGIVEEGRHNELLERQGTYAGLYALQGSF
ncbi:MAG: ABC transporter ATP-binding protein [Pseudomonadales bacterium]|nr:ABC transporter ATP-binding protein [Pseudomonadales bacterium]